MIFTHITIVFILPCVMYQERELMQEWLWQEP